VAVTFKMHMTLIDGKVLNVLTGTKSTQCCPFCNVTPTKVLETKDFSSKTFTPQALSFTFWGESSSCLDQVSRICPEYIIQNGNTIIACKR